jgi:hypothetical protein
LVPSGTDLTHWQHSALTWPNWMPTAAWPVVYKAVEVLPACGYEMPFAPDVKVAARGDLMAAGRPRPRSSYGEADVGRSNDAEWGQACKQALHRNLLCATLRLT